MVVVLGGDVDNETCVVEIADGDGIEVGTSALASVPSTIFSVVDVFCGTSEIDSADDGCCMTDDSDVVAIGVDSEGSCLISCSLLIEGVAVSIGSAFTVVVVVVVSASCIIVSLSRVGDVVFDGADVES